MLGRDPLARIGQDRLRKAEPIGDREGLALAGEADRQPIGRPQGADVELDGGIRHAGVLGGEGLQLGVVRRRRDHRAGVEQPADDRHGQGGALGRIGAGADLVEQDERGRTGIGHEAHDVAQVARERRERLGDALLVADVGHDPPEDRQPRAVGRRDAQPGLVHERQEAERLQRDRLAAGVRPGDDQGPIAEPVAETQVDRDRRVAQQRMARGEQLGGVLGDGRPHAVHLGAQAGAGQPQVGSRQRGEAVPQRRRATLDHPRQLVEDPLLLARGREGCLGPLVVQLDDGQRLDEERGARGALVVDDPLHPALGLGADRDDVAPGAQRHDRLADDPGHRGRAQHRVQALADAVLGGAQPLADGGELRRGRVEDLPALVDAARDPGRQLRRRVEQVADLRQVRAAPGLEPRREPLRRVERLAHLEQLGRSQAPAATRALERGADVPRAADAGLGLVREQPVGLIGLVLEEPDVGRVRDRQGRERPARARARTRSARRAARRSRRTRARGACPRRPRIRRRGQRRETCGSSVIQKRIGRAAHAPA